MTSITSIKQGFITNIEPIFITYTFTNLKNVTLLDKASVGGSVEASLKEGLNGTMQGGVLAI